MVAQWKVLAATMSVTASSNGKKLSKSLRRLAVAADNPAAVQQIMALQRQVDTVEAEIAEAELEVNQLLYQLYGLDADDIRRIEQG